MHHFDWPFTTKNNSNALNALNASKLEAFTTNEGVYLGYIGVFLDDAFKNFHIQGGREELLSKFQQRCKIHTETHSLTLP
jgi:hypothetical protein